jgi:hypothetical protein
MEEVFAGRMWINTARIGLCSEEGNATNGRGWASHDLARIKKRII